jgi:hypothetical protein
MTIIERHCILFLRSIEPYNYELNVHVKQKSPFSDLHGRFYEADWISKKDSPIVLLVMNTGAAKHEASVYIQLNGHPHIIQIFGLVKNDHHSICYKMEDLNHLQKYSYKPSYK